MTPQAALTELLGRIGARNGESVTVSTEELNQWPTAAISALKSQGLLLKARPVKSVVCPGCEQECSMPVHTVTRASAPATSFVVCDKRSDTNRVTIAAARLALWRCDAKAVCGFVAACLGLQPTTVQPSEDGLLPIGMARGNKRTQMLCLRLQGHLALVVGAVDAMPLADGRIVECLDNDLWNHSNVTGASHHQSDRTFWRAVRIVRCTRRNRGPKQQT